MADISFWGLKYNCSAKEITEIYFYQDDEYKYIFI